MTLCENCNCVPGVLLCLLFGVLPGVCSETLSLNGKWSLSNSNGSVSLPAEVPGCVHSALQKQGYIQDPYFRFNDVSYRWIAFENWNYTTTFTVSTQLRSKQKVLLVFDGVDTAFSVRDVLKDGDNVLKVSFLSPVLYASDQRRAHSAYRVPPDCPPDVQHGECHVNFIRKAQSSFSWDWGPSFPTMGLWRGVCLEAFDVLQLVLLSSTTNGTISLSVPELESEQIFQMQFLRGRTKKSFDLHINTSSEVKLWWPNGHGEQPSYLLTVGGLQDGFTILNTESKEPVVGSPGLSFYFRINGKPIFLKGSNWIPANSFQDRVTPDVLRNLLQSAVDANMNALRVWQDFMFACAMYPTDEDFLQTVREEVLHQVQRLKSHPSIIIWSGNNENEAALATIESEKPTYLTDYVKLYVDNIRGIVQEEDQSRPFLVSSPTNGFESEQEGFVAKNPYDAHYGDTHFYTYTEDCLDWRTFPRTRFASEYGYQSWPSFSTLQPVSIEEDWSYNSPFFVHRQHHDSGNQQMLLQASLHFNLPNATDPHRSFTDTLYITQVMQAQCVKAQTEFYRRSRSEILEGKGGTMGALYWQLNDVWQAPSWSSIGVGVRLVFSGSGLHLRSDPLLIPGGSAAAIFKQRVDPLLGGCGHCSRLTCLLAFHLEDSSGQRGPTNHHFLSSPKDAQGLQRPNITASVQEDKSLLTITLHSFAVAPFVWLDVGNIPGRFSSNGFLMLSANTTVSFNAWRPTSAAELSKVLTITSLADVY
ncbi:hypothetical protein F7725_008324 [Dissostichus mawsoni]|uniref:Beta-mannosidase n=1 Tax=Dissostichus mawsoni TaxID=36200 RepID=A0A7J5Y847_DISMA|nr:hypothetical protein F7725_008324 [Dissostichus mawsoni]